MTTSTVHPQNYIVNTTEGNAENGNVPQRQERNCTPTKKCIRFFALIVIVGLIVVCAIVIPLTVSSTPKKTTSQSTTRSTKENETSWEMTTVTLPNTENHTKAISSSTSSDRSDINTTKGTMASEDSSTSNMQSMTSVSPSTSNTDNGIIKTISTDTLTEMSSGWADHPTTTIVSIITDTTNTEPTPASTERPLIALNRMNDTIIGLYNTTAGGSTGGFNGTYVSPSQMPQHAMDDSPKTKYLNNGHLGGYNKSVNGPGIGTGFLVIPSISNSTIACGLLFATADDDPNRDPITVTLEGSNATSIQALNNGASWTLIYNGSTGISAVNSPDRKTNGTQQNFPKKGPFASYRLLITSKRNDSNSVQYSEARIMGYI